MNLIIDYIHTRDPQAVEPGLFCLPTYGEFDNCMDQILLEPWYGQE